MFDFLNEFFKSDLAKNHIAAIIITVILLLGIGFFLGWVYLKFIYYKIKFNKMEETNKLNSELKKENSEFKKENSELKKENEELKTQLKQQSFGDEMETYKQNKDKIDNGILSLIE